MNFNITNKTNESNIDNYSINYNNCCSEIVYKKIMGIF
jgi:hypothetical protein